MEILCHWVFCFVIARNAQQCGRVHTGTKEELASSILKMDGTPGDMLTSECVKKGDRFVIDWGNK